MQNTAQFTVKHLHYLEKMYPEQTTLPADEREMYIRMGQRAVIQHIQFVLKNTSHHDQEIPK